MNEGGIPLFSFEKESPVVDHALITGLFTAMHCMTKEVFLDDIQNLEMGEHRLVFGQRPTLQAGVIYGAIIADVKDNPDLIAKILNKFLNEFVITYEEDIIVTAQVGTHQKYKAFEEHVQVEMKKRLRRFQFLQKKGRKTRGLGLITGIMLFFAGIFSATKYRKLFLLDLS